MSCAKLYVLFLVFFICTCSFLCSKDSLVKSYHTVMVFLEIKPEYIDEVKQEFRQIKVFSDKDEASISFDIYEDSQDIAKVALLEIWESKEAHTKHLTKPYIVDFIQRLKHRLVKPHEVVGGKKLN